MIHENSEIEFMIHENSEIEFMIHENWERLALSIDKARDTHAHVIGWKRGSIRAIEVHAQSTELCGQIFDTGGSAYIWFGRAEDGQAVR